MNSGKTEYYTDSVTYKKGTVILEESQQLKFAEMLSMLGVSVTIEESDAVVEELKNRFGAKFKYVRRK
jgi:hypothetical protein